MRASGEEKRRLRDGGLLPLPTREALALVDRLVLSGRDHLMVASIDWERLKPVYEARRARPFLERFESAPARDTAKRPDLPLPERSLDLKGHLEQEVARTLGLGSGVRLDPRKPLSEMGIDSLMAVQLKNRLESGLGIAVTVRSLLAGATLDDLAKRARAGGEEIPTLSRLERRQGREEVLSFSQERFWFLDQLEPGSSLYANPALFRIRGALDVETLSRALDLLRERHEILRTRFAVVNGQPRQVVMDPLPFPLRVVHLPSGGSDEEALRQAREELARPFDLREGDLARAALFRLSPDDHLLVVNMHHAVSDGWSYRVLLKELGAFYHGASLDPLPVQYADFARWQRRTLSGEVMERQLSYWKRQLAGSPPLLPLPTDFPRPPVQKFRGRQVEAGIEPSVRLQLETLSKAEGATLFMTLLAAFGLLLHRFTGETDISIGSPIAGRHRPEIENSIGVFLNHLVFRSDLSGDPTFRELLGRVRQTALDGYANQDVPFEALLSELAPERDLSKTPLFQVFFNMANLPDYRGAIAGLDVDYLFSALAESKFDLTLYAMERGGTYQLVLVYNADLFEEATARQMLSAFLRLLRAVSESPEERLSRLPLLDGAGATSRPVATPPRSLRPGEGFEPDAAEADGETVVSRFRRVARLHGEAPAVVTASRRLSYADLDVWSDAAAHAVRETCPSSGDRVALLLGHGVPMVVAVMAAVKSGRTYVPLDPSYPLERLATLLDDSGARAILTESEHLPIASKLSRSHRALIDVERAVLPADVSVPEESPADGVAYILYTSGSTGEPKGVMQSYRNLLHHAARYSENVRIGAGDRLSLLPSYTFDAAVMDLYGALLNGAALYPFDVRREGIEGLGTFLDREGITLYHSTPTVFRHFLRTKTDGSRHPSVRAVVLGGEEVHRADVERFRARFSPSTVLVNGLGPTESTLALQYFVGPETSLTRMRVPVGFPVAGTDVLLLSESGAPGQIRGEIAIRSPYVALGYFGREELTRAAFTGPVNGSGARVYRTGDLGRLLPDGSIEFLGRRDSQVKIRGFRIELEEVEAHLERHPGVREAAVIDRAGNGGDAVLAAFVVMREERPLPSETLRRFLADSLPAFMVPAHFQAISRIPMTATGKIDRRALRRLELTDTGSATTEPLRSATEESLAAIWRKLLSVERVARADNFFALGGHSLQATQLALAVRTGFGVEFPLRNLFSMPSIAEMASFIDSERERNGNGRADTPIRRLSREAHRVSGGPRDAAAASDLSGRRS
jgi:amino acid adenylation domain-containing protein